jgi:cell division protein FtsW (lipid II flippase)
MKPFDEIKEYSKTVCEQIRWKRAHKVVAEEIENHITDQRDAYIVQGEDEKSATKKAVIQMGDAVSIGMGLDKTHKPKPQWKMIALTALLMLTGMFISYFMSRFSLIPYIISVTVFLICYFLDFTIFGKYAKELYFIVLATTIIGLLFSSQIYNSVISLSYLSLIFPVTYSIFIYDLRHKGFMGIILCGVAYIPFAAILLLIPSFTGFVLFSTSAFVILSMSIRKGWFGDDKKRGMLLVLIPALIAVFFALFYALQNPYYLSRLSIAINPNLEPYGRGYIPSLVRDFLANSKFIGGGAIPAPHSSNNITILPASGIDYILATLTHKFGWIVFIGISGVVTAFSFFGLYYTSKQKSVLGTLVSVSIIITFIFQALTYIMNNLGFGLLASLSLPLVSYGNTALVINSALIGFMLSVFRTGDVIKDSLKAHTRRNPIFSYEDGKLIINIKGN